MGTVLEVRNVSKLYRLGEIGTGTLSHDLNRWWARIRGKEDPYSIIGQTNRRDQKAESDYVWALKDINFDVEEGEILGIIGANGAGKSTLLKLISRITAPTTGSIRAKGRIASLLEVGTGMHPEMTARENIYLNGAILGMRRHEITRQFDNIIDFAGCRMYVDTPVKRFSSGMRVRLGFAVAAFLQAEILIVDEVLAVGDAEFQKRALGKMQEVATSGRTVLFVSHNMATIAHLCSRALWIADSTVPFAGDPSIAIQNYSSSLHSQGYPQDLKIRQRQRGLRPVISKIEFLNKAGQFTHSIAAGEPLTIQIHYAHDNAISDAYFGLTFETINGVNVFWVQTRLQGFPLPMIPPRGVVVCQIPRLPLVPGVYHVQTGCGTGFTQLDLLPRASQITVIDSDIYRTGQSVQQSQGLVFVDAEWSTETNFP